MIDNNKVKKIIDERIKMHLDDPRIVDKWNDLINIFTEDESETIEYLSNCSEYIVEWASEVLEDVSKSFQSEKFIKCIEALKSKFENLDVEQDIFYAKETIKKP